MSPFSCNGVDYAKEHRRILIRQERTRAGRVTEPKACADLRRTDFLIVGVRTSPLISLRALVESVRFFFSRR